VFQCDKAHNFGTEKIIKMKKVIIIGSSGHAKVVIDIFECMEDHEILGIIDKNKPIGESFFNYNVIGHDHEIAAIAERNPACVFFIAIGDNLLRSKVHMTLKQFYPAIEMTTAIHPSAIIARSVRLGEGTAVMAGAIVNAASTIGKNCIINTGASVDHECIFDDYSSIAPGASTGGNVHLGKCSAIGIGATIMQGLTIGDHSIIGAASLLTRNCNDHEVMYGIPARRIRPHHN
jgi:sugar O-acyltransferase (sialic acid O-acetyltransferase NeuD family)